MSEATTKTTLQASAVAINGRALVLEGAPGVGKSSLALALIERGAMLIGDDGVTLVRDGDGESARLLAVPPPNIEGLLEVRGAKVQYNDPYNPELRVEGGRTYKRTALTEKNLNKADLVVVVTDHSDYDYDTIVRHSGTLLDTRNALKSVRRGRSKIHKL